MPQSQGFSISAEIYIKIAALQFMFRFLAGRNFIPQQPDPAGGPFCGLAEPGNAQGMRDSRLRGNDEEGCEDDGESRGNARSS